MRLERDAQAEAWLAGLALNTEDIDWDQGNRSKNRKHGVEPEDVGTLLRNPFAFAGRIVEPAHDEPRWLALGKSGAGRLLALIFTRRGNRIRPISCRPMRKNEKAIYEKEEKGHHR